MAGIEPASSAWKAEVIATIRHPQANTFPGHGLTDFLGLFQRFQSISIFTLLSKYGAILLSLIPRYFHVLGVDYDIHPCMSPCGPAYGCSNVLSLGHPGLTKNPGICHPGQIRSAGKYATGIFTFSAPPWHFCRTSGPNPNPAFNC